MSSNEWIPVKNIDELPKGAGELLLVYGKDVDIFGIYFAGIVTGFVYWHSNKSVPNDILKDISHYYIPSPPNNNPPLCVHKKYMKKQPENNWAAIQTAHGMR